MKVLVVFSLALAVVSSDPVVQTFTLSEMADAIEDPAISPSLKPLLAEAIDEIMLESEKVKVRSPSGAPLWTVQEIEQAIDNPHTTPLFLDWLLNLYFLIVTRNETGVPGAIHSVFVPALDFSTWSLSDLNAALINPSTNPELVPYLEKARIELKEALANGVDRDFIHIVTPLGLVTPSSLYDTGSRPQFLKRIIEKFKIEKGLYRPTGM